MLLGYPFELKQQLYTVAILLNEFQICAGLLFFDQIVISLSIPVSADSQAYWLKS